MGTNMICGQRAYTLLREIARPRPGGSASERDTAEHLAAITRELGMETAIEEFSVNFCAVDTSWARIIAPKEKELHISAHRFCADTPEEGIEAEIALIENIQNVDWKHYQGKAVLVDGSNDVDLAMLAEAGVVCVFKFEGTAGVKSSLKSATVSRKYRNLLPVFGVHVDDALYLVRNAPVKVRFCIRQRRYEGISQNVVADLKGTDPTGMIILGAHYDSVVEYDGACDNGGGSVVVSELARYFANNTPKQNLRFVWFGDEEEGLEGSKAYIRQHKEELKDILMMLNVDVAGSIIGDYFVMAATDECIISILNFVADELGFPAVAKRGLMGSDSTTFAAKGIPAIGFGKLPANGISFAHNMGDRVELCSPAALAEQAEYIAMFGVRMANAVRFPSCIVPEDLQKKAVEMYPD